MTELDTIALIIAVLVSFFAIVGLGTLVARAIKSIPPTYRMFK